MRWNETTFEQFTLQLAAAGAKRFKNQTPEERQQIRRQASAALRGLPRPAAAAALKRRWADPDYRRRRLEKQDVKALRELAQRFKTRIVSAYKHTRQAKPGSHLTLSERRDFIRRKSQQLHLPAGFVRKILDQVDGIRQRGQPVDLETFDLALRFWGDWERLAQEVASRRNHTFTDPADFRAFQDNLRKTVWKTRRLLKTRHQKSA